MFRLDRGPVCAAMFAAVLSFAAFGQGKLPPGMTMHRLQAGTLDPSGWTLAESTRGAFAVKLPCAFNDFMVDDDTGADVSRVHVVGCMRPDREKYSATRLQYRGSGKARSYFEKNMDPAALSGARKTRTEYHGLPAIDIAMPEQRGCAAMRFILVEPEIVMMVAEAPAEQCMRLRSQVPVFFSSLKIQKTDAK